MKVKLPLVGEVKTGKDAVDPVVQVVQVPEEKSVLGSFLDFQPSALSDEKRVSSKLLKANRGWVYRNNDVIAKEVSNIEFELFRVRVVGEDIEWLPILDHPVLDALDKFNSVTTSADGFYTTQSHRKLTGDAFWYVERVGLEIKNIFILPPDKVEIEIDDNLQVVRYIYKDTIQGKNKEVVYKPEEIIHFRIPNPDNPVRGLGAVEAAADAIDTDSMAVEANKKLFQRGLIGSFILRTESRLTEDQLKQLRSQLNSTYGGVENAWKIPILGSGLDASSVQLSNRDAQFIEQQAWLRDKICSIFGNVKSIITTDDVNRANADATITYWKQTTIRSEYKAITDTLNEFLVPMYGDNLILGFKDPVPEDEAAKIDKAVTLKEKDIITLNEAREILSYEEVEGGDEFGFQRSERQRQEFMDQLPNETVVPKSLWHVNRGRTLRKAKAYAEIEKYKQIKESVKPMARMMLTKENKPVKSYKSFSVNQVMGYHERRINIVDAAEDVFKDAIRQYVNELVTKAVGNVTEESKKLLTPEEKEKEVNRAVAKFTPILSMVAKNAISNALLMIGIETPYIPKRAKAVEDTVQARVRKFAKSMIETDLDLMATIITNGEAEGASVQVLRSSILNAFAESYTKSQAERVARTELLYVTNEASVDAWKQSDVVVGKQWIVASPDDECAEYDGQIVLLDKGFYEESEFTNGDPPLHPNCECSIVPVLEGELAVSPEALKLKEAEEQLAKFQKQIDKEAKEKQKLTEELVRTEAEKQELEDFIHADK